MIIAATLLGTSLLSTALLGNDASACGAGGPTVLGTIPADSAAEVPTDVRLGVWWEDFPDDPVVDSVVVKTDEGSVDWTGLSETLRHPAEADAVTGLLLWTPDKELPPGARVKVDVTTADHTRSVTTFSFIVGNAPTEEAIAAPSLLSLTVRELTEDPSAPCGDARRVFHGAVSIAAEPTDLSWLFLHRVTPGGTLGDWFTVLGTAADAPQDFSVSSTDLTLELAAECFTLVQVDAAGNRVSSAEPRCAELLSTRTPPADSAKGCTSVPTTPRSLLAWLMLLPAAVLRRRKPQR